MKTSDLGAYSHIETLTGSANVLSFRGLFINCPTTAGNVVLTGTTWEKQTDSPTTYKAITMTVSVLQNSSTILPISFRTLTTVTATNVSVFGLR